MQCLYCGERLSVSQRFRYKAYCSSEHRDAFISQRDLSAVDELRLGRQKAYRSMEINGSIAPDSFSTGTAAGEESIAQLLAQVEVQCHYYQNLLDRLPCGVSVFDSSLKLVYSNRSFRELFEAAPRLEVGVQLSDLCSGVEAAHASERIRRTGEQQEFTETVGDRDVQLLLVCSTPNREEGDREYVLSVHLATPNGGR